MKARSCIDPNNSSSALTIIVESYEQLFLFFSLTTYNLMTKCNFKLQTTPSPIRIFIFSYQIKCRLFENFKHKHPCRLQRRFDNVKSNIFVSSEFNQLILRRMVKLCLPLTMILQLAGETGSHDGRHNAPHGGAAPESWLRVLEALRSTSDFYQRQRRFADDDAVS